MKNTTQKWLYGLGAAMIGGSAQAVVSGLTGMGFAPEKFNFTNASGIWHLASGGIGRRQFHFLRDFVSGVLPQTIAVAAGNQPIKL